MGKIIAVVNQKGGVGKTTSAVNLTAALHELGVRVLLCDFDPQANATSGMGIDKRKIKYSVYDVTINGVPTEQAICKTKFGDVLPSAADLAGATVELINENNRERRLAAALEQVKDQYRQHGEGSHAADGQSCRLRRSDDLSRQSVFHGDDLRQGIHTGRHRGQLRLRQARHPVCLGQPDRRRSRPHYYR